MSDYKRRVQRARELSGTSWRIFMSVAILATPGFTLLVLDALNPIPGFNRQLVGLVLIGAVLLPHLIVEVVLATRITVMRRPHRVYGHRFTKRTYQDTWTRGIHRIFQARDHEATMAAYRFTQTVLRRQAREGKM